MRYFLRLGLFLFFCTGSHWLFGNESCLDSQTGFPKGTYIGKHCDNKTCVKPKFNYDAEADLLSLSRYILSGNFEGELFDISYDESKFEGRKVLSDACAWVNAGFDIAIHMEGFARVDFMLIPLQPEPDYEIADNKEVSNRLGEEEGFLSNIFVKDFRHSCPQFKLYIKSDVIVYRCNAEFRVESSFYILPYFYRFQDGVEFPVILENRSGTLMVLRVFRVKNKLAHKELDFMDEIKRQCKARFLEPVEVPGGYICHKENPDWLSESLKQSTKHTVYIDSSSGYAVLYDSEDKSHLDVLMGVDQCLERGLKLDYLERHHWLFCVPDKFSDPKQEFKDDREEL